MSTQQVRKAEYTWSIIPSSPDGLYDRIKHSKPGNMFKSNGFECLGFKWNIQLYPNGSDINKFNPSECYLCIHPSSYPQSLHNIEADITFKCQYRNTNNCNNPPFAGIRHGTFSFNKQSQSNTVTNNQLSMQLNTNNMPSSYIINPLSQNGYDIKISIHIIAIRYEFKSWDITDLWLNNPINALKIASTQKNKLIIAQQEQAINIIKQIQSLQHRQNSQQINQINPINIKNQNQILSQTHNIQNINHCKPNQRQINQHQHQIQSQIQPQSQTQHHQSHSQSPNMSINSHNNNSMSISNGNNNNNNNTQNHNESMTMISSQELINQQKFNQAISAWAQQFGQKVTKWVNQFNDRVVKMEGDMQEIKRTLTQNVNNINTNHNHNHVVAVPDNHVYHGHHTNISSTNQVSTADNEQYKRVIMEKNKCRSIEREQFKAWFNNNGISKYYQIFIENGIESMDVMKLVTERELNLMGITKLGHKLMIMNGIKKLNMNMKPVDGDNDVKVHRMEDVHVKTNVTRIKKRTRDIIEDDNSNTSETVSNDSMCVMTMVKEPENKKQRVMRQ